MFNLSNKPGEAQEDRYPRDLSVLQDLPEPPLIGSDTPSPQPEVKFPETAAADDDEPPSPLGAAPLLSAAPLMAPRLRTIFTPFPHDERAEKPKESAQPAREPFVKLSDYNLLHSEIVVLERDLLHQRQEIGGVLQLKSSFDSSLLKFQESMEDMERKLMLVERNLFKSI